VFHLITAVADGISYSYQDNSGASGGAGIVGYLLFTIIALRPVFAKAGYNGWSALIPIYNIYRQVKLAGLHGAFTILYFIPIVNIIVAIIVAVKLGANFGKGGAFSFFLLWLLAFIGFCIVGYGSARYTGPDVGPRGLPA
jgi:hypothetical protein